MNMSCLICFSTLVFSVGKNERSLPVADGDCQKTGLDDPSDTPTKIRKHFPN